MTNKQISFEEAKKAKEILLEYIKSDDIYISSSNELLRERVKISVFLALTQDFFLD